MRKTIFLDIDGTILEHHNSGLSGVITKGNTPILPGVLKKLDEWEAKGYRIILTTGRKESMRAFTEHQLSVRGIYYDDLIMGLQNGDRIIINDKKPDGRETAFAINIDRNTGLDNVEV